MFTVCPKCTLTLVVTTVDLRAGQGYVRCGRCANVFNALIALREADPNSASSDSARQRIMEQPPRSAAVQPALGSGVALEPEPAPPPAPEPEPEPEPEPQPEPEPEPPQEPEPELTPGPEAAREDDLSFGDEAEEASAEGSLEFDATATDVSEIFVSPSQAEHDTGSGSYEAVVLGVDPPEPESESQPEPEAAPEFDHPAHTDTIAADDWSLLDDDEPAADAESVIEESPLAEAQEPEPEAGLEFAAEAEPEATQETSVEDPAWVHDMFAEAEAEAIRSRTAENRALEAVGIVDEGEGDESAVVQAARDVKGVSAPSGDTVLEPLLAPAATARRPAWQYISGISLLALLLVLQVLHYNRRSLVLNPTFGPVVSTVYGWFGSTITPRWDLDAYTVRQLGVESEGSDASRLRVRLSVQNDSDRVQPLPLVRLTLTDRFDKPVATRDLQPREYLPPKIADRRLLEPNQRIDGELHVIDPGRAAVGFEIDACLRSENGQIGCANQLRRTAD